MKIKFGIKFLFSVAVFLCFSFGVAFSVQKVILGNVSVPVTEVAPGEHAYSYAFLGTVDNTVHKVKLQDFTLEATLDLNSVARGGFYFGDIDLIRKKLVLGAQDLSYYPRRIVFIDYENFTLDGYLDLDSDVNIQSLIVDQVNGIAYATDVNNNRIYKIDITTRTNLGYTNTTGIFHVGLNYNGANDSSYVYFLSYNNPPRVARIRKSDFTYVGYLEIGNANQQGGSGRNAIEEDLGFLYFATNTRYGLFDTIEKIDTSTFTSAGTINLNNYEIGVRALAIDKSNRFLYAYFNNDSTPLYGIIKVNLSSFTVDSRLYQNYTGYDITYDGKRDRLYVAKYYGMVRYNTNPLSYIDELWLEGTCLCIFSD